MLYHPRKLPGFTIVELLIVIVVIAILAAITVVAYNGMQQRANNTAIIGAANQDYKLLLLYLQGEGHSPATYSACFGDNTDRNGDSIGDCGSSNGVTNQVTAFNDALAKYGTPIGDRNMPTVTDGGTSYQGIAYYYNSPTRLVDGLSNTNVIFYYLVGQKQDCSNTNTLKDNGDNTWSTGTGQKYTYTSSGHTSCYVAVK